MQLSDLKTTLGGGYDRESVLLYIRFLNEEFTRERGDAERAHHQEMERLNAELERLRAQQQPKPETGAIDGGILQSIQELRETMEAQLAYVKTRDEELEAYHRREAGLQERARQAEAEAEQIRLEAQRDAERISLAAEAEVRRLREDLENELARERAKSAAFIEQAAQEARAEIEQEQRQWSGLRRRYQREAESMLRQLLPLMEKEKLNGILSCELGSTDQTT